MKDYIGANRNYESIKLANKIFGVALLPVLFLLILTFRTMGMPYPILPLSILCVSFYICMRISMASIRSGLSQTRTFLTLLIISSILNVVSVHYTGGIESPFFVLFALIFIISSMVLPARQSIFLVILSCILYFSEIWLEYFMIVPHIHIYDAFNPKIYQDTHYLASFSLIIIAVVIGITSLTVYITRTINSQIKELQREKANSDNLVQELKKASATLEKKIEERTREITESEEKYRNMVECAFDGIFILQGNAIKFVNKKFEELSGYSSVEAVNRDFTKMVAPESLESVVQIELKRQKGEEVPESYEFIGIRKDGRKVDVEIYATTINYEGEIATQGYVRDITQKKRVEAKIRYLKEFNENILENLKDMVFVHDEKGKFTFVNKAGVKKIGYTKEELLKMSCRDITPPDVSKEIRNVLNERSNSGTPIYKGEIISRTGDKMAIEVNATRLYENGKQSGAVFVARDLREVMRLESEIRETKAFIESILDSSIDGITTLDNKGYITYISRRTQDMFNIKLRYNEDELIGKHISEFYVRGIEEAKKIYNLLIENGGRLYNYETELTSKDGFIRPIIVSVSQLKDGGGKVIGTLGIYKDISERKRLEQEIAHRNEELENFVYTISHDLKSPLVSLQGFASILKEDFANKIDEDGKHYLERIEKNANYMEELIADLLELSRVGKAEGAYEETDLSKIAEDIKDEMISQLEKGGISFITNDTLPYVYCNRKRIRQLLENLISNSIKFMGEEKSPFIEVGCEDRGRFFKFYVKDNGIGIEEKYHEKIFLIFQRLREIDGVEGTGIGLSIVKRIVENHGGKIWVESERGEGTTFYFTLPK
ncbi:MAG: PAS domain S-box protein [Thermodesulfobacteriota bacterium]|nr:PAS domain S-box protein [Thermodesulfobacteriota bacterium]